MPERDAPAGREPIEWLSGGIEPPERAGPRTRAVGSQVPRLGLGRRGMRRILFFAGVAAIIGITVVTGFDQPPRHDTAAATHPSPAGQAVGGLTTAPVAVDRSFDAPSSTFLSTLGKPGRVPLLAPQGAAGLVSMPWELVKVTGGGRVLDIVYAAGDGTCYRMKGFEVLETTATVEVLALVAHSQPPSTMCPVRLDLGYAAVPLAHRLGHRFLLHGPVESGWVNALRGL